MAKVFRVVIGLRHRPQRRDVHQFAKVGILGLRQKPVQMRGFQNLPLGQSKARRLGHLAQRVQLFNAGFFMHAKQQRAFQPDQFFGGGHIGQHHEFLNQPMRIKAFGESHRLHFAVVTQHDLAFGQIQFQRLTCGACQFQAGISGIDRGDHTVQQVGGFVIGAAIHRVLHLRVIQAALRPHQAPRETVADLMALCVDHHLHGQTGAIHMFVQ